MSRDSLTGIPFIFSIAQRVIICMKSFPFTERIFQEKFLSILALEFVGDRIEVKSTGDREGSDEFGAGDESMRRGVGVVSPREVTVVRGDDRVLVSFLDVLTIPLTDARPASVSQHGASEVSKSLRLNLERILEYLKIRFYGDLKTQ